MKKNFFLGVATCLAIFALEGIVNASIIQTNSGIASPAISISFDELSISQGTLVTDQYGSYGVTFSPNLTQWTSGISLPNIDPNQLTNFDPITTPFDINFLTDQTEVAFAFATNTSTITLETFLEGTSIETVSLNTTFGDAVNGNNWLLFSGYSFDQISISVTGQDEIFDKLINIDNMQLGTAPVPEPATMLLLGAGLVGLAGVRKKFKKS